MNNIDPITLDYLVYTSVAVDPFDDEGLSRLLCQSRETNAQRHITGALLYKNGVFVQLLEGPESAVEELREKIYSDTRHCGVMTLIRGKTKNRAFSDWSMHAVPSDVSNAKDSTLIYRCLKNSVNIDDLLKAAPGAVQIRPEGMHPGLRLLLTFRQVM